MGVVGIPLTVAAKIFYQDNMAQACGIHFLLRVWTRVDSLASESDHCQERDAKPNSQ